MCDHVVFFVPDSFQTPTQLWAATVSNPKKVELPIPIADLEFSLVILLKFEKSLVPELFQFQS